MRHGFNAAALHGDLDQSARTAALDSFRNGEVKLLIASDVAARGLDIPDVSHVFNFDVPHHADDYVHRIGRTGRAGKTGTAITIVGPADGKAVAEIEKLIGQSIAWADEPRRRGAGEARASRRAAAASMRPRPQRRRARHRHEQRGHRGASDAPRASDTAIASRPSRAEPRRPPRSPGSKRHGTGSAPRAAHREPADQRRRAFAGLPAPSGARQGLKHTYRGWYLPAVYHSANIVAARLSCAATTI